MKRVAILQSNYIPWKGYFDIIAGVDELILYDDVQYTKNDWRNRNRIKTPQGPMWLSIPVGPDIRRRVRDVTLPSRNWRQAHWKTLEHNYRTAPYFNVVAELLAPFYFQAEHTHLSALNRALIERINAYLGIATKLSWSWEYDAGGGRTERLVELCAQAGATEYVSGPAARNYLDCESFAARGIPVIWFDYTGYPEYPQPWGAFDHHVSVLDLLFSCGPSAGSYMKHVVR
jgi:hypothetical protein